MKSSLGLVQGPPEALAMGLAISHIAPPSLVHLPCPQGFTWRRCPRRTVLQPAEDAVFSRRDIIRAELRYAVLVPALFSSSQRLPLPIFVPLLYLEGAAKSSPAKPSQWHMLPLPWSSSLHLCLPTSIFFRLMTAAEGLPAAFRGVNTSLPLWDASLRI